jgi:F0F1-type ATP synthase assembly protein I
MGADALAGDAAGGVGGGHAHERPVNSASVGIALVMSTVLGLASGYDADRLLGTAPWLAMIGLGVGIAAGFVNLFRAR